MRMRKEMIIENPTTQIATPTTEITKVVATKVDERRDLTIEQASAVTADASADYDAAIEKVRAALVGYGRATWQLAWALVEFREVHERLHPDDRLTDKQVVAILDIKLTPTCVGQLVNTARAYPREQVDESIDFRVYENARMFTEKTPKMTPLKRLKLVKAHPTTDEIAKLKPKPAKSSNARRELTIRVTRAAGAKGEPEVVAQLNGVTIEVPAKVLKAITAYAVDAFAESR
jgi:hypothetical protein